MKRLAVFTIALSAAAAWAKLPAPNEEAKAKAEEAKAKAEEAKAKTAWSDKVAAFQICKAQDRVVAYYLKTKSQDAKPMPMPPCTDPGPYVPGVAGAQAYATPAATTPAAAPVLKK